MLIELSVGNYRSFKDPVTLSMVASNIVSKDKQIDWNNIFEVEEDLKLLKSAAIYGANASGKSNLVSALRFMRNFVLNSSKETQSTEAIEVERFKLSIETDDQPSFFQVVFLLEGKKYRYGFEADTQRIISEWLYYVPKTREAKLFERRLNDISTSSNFKEGKGLEGRTRDNALFLSVVAQFNGVISRKILLWFRMININLGINDMMEHSYAVQNFEKVRDKNAVFNLIKRLDLGIDSIEVEKTSDNKPLSLAEFFQGGERIEQVEIKTLHRKYDAKGLPVLTETFDMEDHESEGTKRIFTLAGPILETLSRGHVALIDELDARLHPLMTCAIIGLFNNNETNPRNAQLIFTTHDTNLLSNKMFRRDQIWFTEKDRYGSTHLYSLAEFKVRNDASFERDYIRGKYGAIPFIGDLQYTLEIGDEQEKPT